MIAVVIPTRNGAAWLPDALESVRAQGDVVSEILVVDDGSSDGTAEVLAARPDVTAIRHETPRGPAAARNSGVSASSAPLIAFLDVDDLYTDDALPHRLEVLREGRHDLVATQMFRSPMGASLPRVPETDDTWWAFSFGASLITRDAWNRVGPIDESLLRGEDADWWLRARAVPLRIQRSDRVTLIVRTHSDSWSGTAEQRAAATFDVIRRRLAQR